MFIAISTENVIFPSLLDSHRAVWGRCQKGLIVDGDNETDFPKAIEFDRVTRASNDHTKACNYHSTMSNLSFLFHFFFSLPLLFFLSYLPNYKELGCTHVYGKNSLK